MAGWVKSLVWEVGKAAGCCSRFPTSCNESLGNLVGQNGWEGISFSTLSLEEASLSQPLLHDGVHCQLPCVPICFLLCQLSLLLFWQSGRLARSFLDQPDPKVFLPKMPKSVVTRALYVAFFLLAACLMYVFNFWAFKWLDFVPVLDLCHQDDRWYGYASTILSMRLIWLGTKVCWGVSHGPYMLWIGGTSNPIQSSWALLAVFF